MFLISLIYNKKNSNASNDTRVNTPYPHSSMIICKPQQFSLLNPAHVHTWVSIYGIINKTILTFLAYSFKMLHSQQKEDRDKESPLPKLLLTKKNALQQSSLPKPQNPTQTNSQTISNKRLPMSFFFLFSPSQARISFQLKPFIMPKLQYQGTSVMLSQSNRAQMLALLPQKLKLQSMADQVINTTLISLKLTFN